MLKSSKRLINLLEYKVDAGGYSWGHLSMDSVGHWKGGSSGGGRCHGLTAP